MLSPLPTGHIPVYEYLNILKVYNYANIVLRFSNNSKANASELLVNLEEILEEVM